MFKIDFCLSVSYIKYFFFFDIEYIKKDTNYTFDFLTREFQQHRSWYLLNPNLEKKTDPQTKSKSKKSQKSQNSTKLLQSAISSAKQIKSWYGAVIKEEEEEHSSIVQN